MKKNSKRYKNLIREEQSEINIPKAKNWFETENKETYQ